MYVIDASNQLHVVSETQYNREIDLQQLVADHPSLLGGDQMNAANPRTFLLIAAEAGISISETSGNLFALDLLFIDQDGVPTLVEVKRSSDTRIRREVVSQLLEYAANFCSAWTADRMLASFENLCREKGTDPLAEASTLSRSPNDFIYDDLWARVAANLQLGKLRLVLLADDIPITALRIVEFLNARMERTEVYAVKVSQHVGGGARILSTRVLNPSQEAVEKKDASSASRRGDVWTGERFFADLRMRAGAEAVVPFQAIERWAQTESDVVPYFGRGLKDGSIQVTALRKTPTYNRETDVVFLTLWSYGRASIEFAYLAMKPPFDSENLREQLRLRLNEIPGISIAEDQLARSPSLHADVLREPSAVSTFLEIQDWLLEQMRIAWKIG